MRLKLESVRIRIMVIIMAAVALPVAAILVTVAIERRSIGTNLTGEVRIVAERNVSDIARGIYNLCESQHRALVDRLALQMAVARDKLDERGPVGLASEQVTWDAVNQLTQQNAANSEESASAAEELSSQAEELRSLVAAFKIDAPPSQRGWAGGRTVEPDAGGSFEGIRRAA